MRTTLGAPHPADPVVHRPRSNDPGRPQATGQAAGVDALEPEDEEDDDEEESFFAESLLLLLPESPDEPDEESLELLAAVLDDVVARLSLR
jgi:hypothetical protein